MWEKRAKRALNKSAKKAINELDPELVDIKPINDYFTSLYLTVIPPYAQQVYNRFKKDIGVPLTDDPEWVNIILRYLGSSEIANRIVGINENTKRIIREVIIQGLGDGLSNQQIRSAIRQSTALSTARAMTISRTETGIASSSGEYVGAQRLALDGFPIKKTWLAAMDSRTRDSHAFMNGTTIGLNEKFNVNGWEMSRPLDPAGPASEVINCRCTLTFSL